VELEPSLTLSALYRLVSSSRIVRMERALDLPCARPRPHSEVNPENGSQAAGANFVGKPRDLLAPPPAGRRPGDRRRATCGWNGSANVGDAGVVVVVA